MIDGRGSVLETVLITPRPFMTISAFPERISPIARRVVHTLRGSKLAFRTSTGSLIQPPNWPDYSTIELMEI
jgi:hypothetical protein